MALREKLHTADEFFEIASLPENEDKRLELDDGVIVDIGSSSQLNTVTAARIGYFLNAYVIPNNLGYVTGADGGFKLTDEQMVYVMRLDADGSIRSIPFGMDDTLDGGEVLPGFTLPVREVFPQ